MEMPLVSVILPARNEARNITDALQSLLTLHYPHLEILVVDDCSTDNTAALAREYIKNYKGLVSVRLLQSPTEPPEGWVGKTFAADVAIQHSSGDILLICDADVRHGTESMTKAVEQLQQQNLDLLSQLPHFEVRSVGEYPLLFQTFLLYFTSSIARLLGSRQSFAMGTYLMFTREFYKRSGGWRAHRAYPESLPLLNYCIAHGRNYRFLPDRGEVLTHMHDGTKETFLGLVRNSNFALLQPIPLALFIATVMLFSSAFGLALRGSTVALLIVIAIMAIFTVHLIRSRYSLPVIVTAVALSPLMPFYLLVVAITSLCRKFCNAPIPWRGRLMQP